MLLIKYRMTMLLSSIVAIRLMNTRWILRLFFWCKNIFSATSLPFFSLLPFFCSYEIITFCLQLFDNDSAIVLHRNFNQKSVTSSLRVELHQNNVTTRWCYCIIARQSYTRPQLVIFYEVFKMVIVKLKLHDTLRCKLIEQTQSSELVIFVKVI